MLIYCIRHGESTSNSEGRIQGQLDVPLSRLGEQQALALAAALKAVPLDAVVSSPLQRAAKTAEPIAAAHGIPLEFDDRLRELHAGVFQGLLHWELNDLFPQDAVRWRSGDPDFCIPGGESRRDLMRRGHAVIEAIRQTAHRHVAVVSHGGLLAGAFKSLLGIAAEHHPFALYNASISTLSWEPNLKLLNLNQIDHLRLTECQVESRTGDL